MGKVAIIGVGQSAFVRSYPGAIRELVFEGFKEALQDSRITANEIDASVVCSAPEYDKQRSPAGVFAEYLGLNPQPTFYVETLCSSGSTGLRLAYSLIESGLHDVVAVIGFQKMSEISSSESRERMGRGADIQWESPFGTMMPAYYAMYARAHMEAYGSSPDDLTLIRVKAATYGQINEKAVYRKPVAFEMLSDPENRMSGMVASPLRVGDCCANADGSSCIIVASEEKAKSLSNKPVWILGLGAASASVNLAGRTLFTGLTVAQQAAEQAYTMAGVTPRDIDVAEVHDCFTIAELMAYENLGFAKPGEGKEFIRGKETHKDGSIPVNLDGGLLSKGHPIGATGGSQIRTIVLQLRGEAGDMQVNNPELGLVHNIGGVGLYGNVTILGEIEMGKKKEVDIRFNKFGTVSFTAITKINDFIDYLEEGKVMGTRCNACGLVFFPPRADCFRCLNSDMEWFEVSGKATLVSYSRLEYAPAGFDADVPYYIALLDYGKFKVFGRITGDTPEEALSVGSLMQVKVSRLPDDRVTYIFEKA